MDRDLAEINASLQRSERILKGMQSWTASIRKSWTSYVPEVPKLFGKSRTDVAAESRDKEVKDELGVTPNDDRDAFYVPRVLVQDAPELEKLVKSLEEKKRFTRKSEEKLLYFYHNSANLKLFSMDQTAMCILVTNRRLVKLEGGVEVCSHEYLDIAQVDREDATPGRFEKLVFTLRNGERAVVGIWSKEVTVFLEKCLKKISQGNKINLDLVKTKSSKGEIKVTPRKSDRQFDHSEYLRQKAGRELTSEEEAYIEREATKRTKQDKHLDILNGILDEVLAKGQNIKSELDYQDKILNHLDTRLDSTNDRIKNSNKKIDKLLKK